MSAFATSAATWETLPSMPEPNGGFVAGAVNGKVVVLGGTNWADDQKRWLASVQCFDPAKLTWSSWEPLASPIAYGIGVNQDAEFLVVGGTTGQQPWRGIIRVNNGAVTTSPSGGLEKPAVLSTGGVIREELVVVGGTDDAANVSGLRKTTIGFEVKTGRTRTLNDYPGRGLGVAATVVANGELFVFTGANWDADSSAVVNSAEAYVFSLERNEWRQLRSYPFAVRGAAAVALDERRMYLAGGYADGGFTDRAFIYDMAADRYTPAPALPYRGQVGLVRCGEYVYCLGGEDRMKHRSAAAYRISVRDLLVQTSPSAETQPRPVDN